MDPLRPALLVAGALFLSAVSTVTVLRLRREETRHEASGPFVVGVTLFNVVLFGFLATLVP